MMRRIGRREMISAAGCAVLLLVAASCGSDEGAGDESTGTSDDAGEQDAEEVSFDGETIEIWVPADPGGGADRTAQLFAAALEEYAPGGPDVELVYLPGAGGAEAGNRYAALGERDGTTLLLLNVSMNMGWYSGDETFEWNLPDFTPIGNVPFTNIWGTHPDLNVATPGDLPDVADDLVFGHTAAHTAALPDVLAMELLGIRESVDEIYGYQGGSGRALAYEQGETNLLSLTTGAWLGRTDLYEDGLVDHVLAVGYPRDGELEPEPAYPDLPTVQDAYEEIHGEAPSGELWDAFVQATQAYTFGAGPALHADTDPAIVAALIEAVEQAAQDEEWQAMKDDLVGPIEPIVGEEAEVVGAGFAAIDEDVLDFTRNWIAENYDE